MAIVVTSKGTAGANSSTDAVLSSLTITAGNTIVAAVAEFTTGTITCTYNDGATNYAMTQVSTGGSNRVAKVFYLYNVAAASGSGSITLHSTVNGTKCFCAYEISGLLTSANFDQQASGSGRDTTPTSGATPTTAQASEVVIGVISCDTTDGTFNGTCTDNVQLVDPVAGNIAAHAATKIVSSTGTYSISKTGMTKDYWAAAVATFKAQTSNIKTVNDLVKSSCKTVSDLQISSVKSINDLA